MTLSYLHTMMCAHLHRLKPMTSLNVATIFQIMKMHVHFMITLNLPHELHQFMFCFLLRLHLLYA